MLINISPRCLLEERCATCFPILAVSRYRSTFNAPWSRPAASWLAIAICAYCNCSDTAACAVGRFFFCFRVPLSFRFTRFIMLRKMESRSRDKSLLVISITRWYNPADYNAKSDTERVSPRYAYCAVYWCEIDLKVVSCRSKCAFVGSYFALHFLSKVLFIRMLFIHVCVRLLFTVDKLNNLMDFSVQVSSKISMRWLTILHLLENFPLPLIKIGKNMFCVYAKHNRICMMRWYNPITDSIHVWHVLACISFYIIEIKYWDKIKRFLIVCHVSFLTNVIKVKLTLNILLSFRLN